MLPKIKEDGDNLKPKHPKKEDQPIYFFKRSKRTTLENYRRGTASFEFKIIDKLKI